jgi:hypothetical protein
MSNNFSLGIPPNNSQKSSSQQGQGGLSQLDLDEARETVESKFYKIYITVIHN